jgi:4'-phosphopantetheinyl transferase
MVQKTKGPPAIFPVILKVPADRQGLPPRLRTQFLSRLARQAVRLSAERLGVELGALQKDHRGAPLPFKGNFWSLTHKPKYVAGVVAPAKIGIDVEPVRPCHSGLFLKTASEPEWALAIDGDRLQTFFRFWTAKEAVLKTGGEGIKDLSLCRVVEIQSGFRLRMEYAGQVWSVDQFFFDGHVASVVNDGFRVEWLLLEWDCSATEGEL